MSNTSASNAGPASAFCTSRLAYLSWTTFVPILYNAQTLHSPLHNPECYTIITRSRDYLNLFPPRPPSFLHIMSNISASNASSASALCASRLACLSCTTLVPTLRNTQIVSLLSSLVTAIVILRQHYVRLFISAFLLNTFRSSCIALPSILSKSIYTLSPVSPPLLWPSFSSTQVCRVKAHALLAKWKSWMFTEVTRLHTKHKFYNLHSLAASASSLYTMKGATIPSRHVGVFSDKAPNPEALLEESPTSSQSMGQARQSDHPSSTSTLSAGTRTTFDKTFNFAPGKRTSQCEILKAGGLANVYGIQMEDFA